MLNIHTGYGMDFLQKFGQTDSIQDLTMFVYSFRLDYTATGALALSQHCLNYMLMMIT